MSHFLIAMLSVIIQGVVKSNVEAPQRLVRLEGKGKQTDNLLSFIVFCGSVERSNEGKKNNLYMVSYIQTYIYI